MRSEITDDPRTFREVGMLIREIKDDVREIKAGQQKVIWWVAGMVSSLLVGGVLGWLFQK